jgi:hypothetical protein
MKYHRTGGVARPHDISIFYFLLLTTIPSASNNWGCRPTIIPKELGEKYQDFTAKIDNLSNE